MSALAYLDAAMDADFYEALDGGSALREEMDALAAGVTWPRVRRLIEMGVPAALVGELNGAGDLAFARVSLSGGGRFFEFPGPDARLILGVREQGVLVDLMAIHSEQPDDWALRRGAGWCLGYDAWLACESGRAQVLRIVGTPMDWLLSGGPSRCGSDCVLDHSSGRTDEGTICVLDWEAALPMLRGLGEGVLLRCDRGAGERLEALLRRGGLPRVKEVPAPLLPTPAVHEAKIERRAA